MAELMIFTTVLYLSEDCLGFERESKIMDEARGAVRQLIQEILNGKNDRDGFTDSDSMIFSGRLQSVDVLDLVVFLEERFGLDFSEGFDQARLDSVDEIIRLAGGH